jgi:hypothetical protein
VALAHRRHFLRGTFLTTRPLQPLYRSVTFLPMGSFVGDPPKLSALLINNLVFRQIECRLAMTVGAFVGHVFHFGTRFKRRGRRWTGVYYKLVLLDWWLSRSFGHDNLTSFHPPADWLGQPTYFRLLASTERPLSVLQVRRYSFHSP